MKSLQVLNLLVPIQGFNCEAILFSQVVQQSLHMLNAGLYAKYLQALKGLVEVSDKCAGKLSSHY